MSPLTGPRALLMLLKGRNAARKAADQAYRRVVEQSRQPVFFTEHGVPDTLDGRFELICLHAFLYLHRLKPERPQANEVCQEFFDRMFADFDRALREMGVGDLSVGKHVKHMARAFFGRVSAYDTALEADPKALRAALARNLFGTVFDPTPFVYEMANYVQAAERTLARQSTPDLLAGCIAFEAPGRAPVVVMLEGG